MPLFQYTGRDSQGNTIKGEVEANSKELAADQVMLKGVLPTQVKEKSAARQSLQLSAVFTGHVKISDLIVFTRQIYSLTKAGIPILRALNGLAESTHSKLLSSALYDVLERMHNGYSLSAAMAAHPHVFSQLYTSLIQVGENTGQLQRSRYRNYGDGNADPGRDRCRSHKNGSNHRD